MTKLVLGLDLDGTLADHTQAKLMLAREFGFVLSPEETPAEIIEQILPDSVLQSLKSRLYNELSHMSPRTPWVREALGAMREQGWEFAIVSRRSDPFSREAAHAWLARELPGLVAPERVFFVGIDAEKDAVCRREGIAAFIDDQAEVLRSLVSVPHRFFYDPFGNQSRRLSSEIRPFRSWTEVPDLVAQSVGMR